MKKIIQLLALTLFVFTSQQALSDGHSTDSLDAVLASQDEAAKARYQYRNPKQTLEFFGVKPGMKVIEPVPGGGWYTKILLPYLGTDGHVTGVDYALDMWKQMGRDDEWLEKRKSWSQEWAEKAKAWTSEEGASVDSTTFGTFSADGNGTYDAALFIRALHGLSRNNAEGAYLDKALSKVYDALKPGGIVGVVQHKALEDRPDEWADGSNGYLKQSAVIANMEKAGFEFVAESDINANDKDQAAEGDFVWRLPPSLSGSKDNEELKAKMLAIGESNRMTLLFKKPAS